MSTTLEQQVAEEQAEHEANQTPEPVAEEGGQTQVFDKSDYDREDLALPKVDGEATDKIAIKFSGRVMLDRTDPRDVALMRAMRLGSDITLMVEAKCAGKGHGFTTNKEGDLDAVVLEHVAKVHSVYRGTDGAEPEADDGD